MKCSLASLIFLVSLSAVVAVSAVEGDQAVLVTASGKAGLTPFSQAELRRLYLGFRIYKNGVAVHPLINVSQPDLYARFLQNVVFMSEQHYERQLVRRVLDKGGIKPRKIAEQEKLLEALTSGLSVVTFMNKATADQLPQLTVIQTLW